MPEVLESIIMFIMFVLLNFQNDSLFAKKVKKALFEYKGWKWPYLFGGRRQDGGLF